MQFEIDAVAPTKSLERLNKYSHPLLCFGLALQIGHEDANLAYALRLLSRCAQRPKAGSAKESDQLPPSHRSLRWRWEDASKISFLGAHRVEYLRRRCVAMSATAEFRIRVIFPRSPTLMVTPKSPASGPAGYNIFTVYGGLDGTKDQASAVLDREAKRLCGGA
jgi:hypothetical protein